MKINSYKDLIVWQKTIKLVTEIYKLTKAYPKSELYGLTTHTRKTAISIPSNIAEGRRRGSKKDFRQFIIIAYGSGAELETQLEIAKNLSFGNPSDLQKTESLLTEIMKMLNKMLSSLAPPPA